MQTGLSALAPDILLLQEVFSSRDGKYNTAKVLAETLGMKTAFHSARAKIRRLDGEPIACASGLAILSRPELVWSERLVLPCDPRDGERIAQFAEIRVDRLRLLIVNLHLSHLRHADNLRRQQLTRIVERIEHVWDHDHILLGGDFNVSESNGVFDVLAGQSTFVVSRAPSENPIGLGIDHLFLLTRTTAAPVTITSARAVLDTCDADSGLQASDHIGVMATLAFG
jgi:endonuclease/exonuclease/phosphatase family metal-dependent hydrolase